MNRTDALGILHTHMSSVNLRRHSYAVGAVMSALGTYLYERNSLSETEKAGRTATELSQAWEAVGLLHDGDYESTKNDPSRHTLLMHDWLTESGVNNHELLSAILSHNFAHTGSNKPRNRLEWSLYACDELTGLIIAVALVRPERSLAAVTVEAVERKWPQKAFAAGVNREQIATCEKNLGIPLHDFIGIALTAMQAIHSELGL